MITKTANELVKEAWLLGLAGKALSGLGSLAAGTAKAGWGAAKGTWGLMGKFVPKDAGFAGKALGYGGAGFTLYQGAKNIGNAATGGVANAALKSAYMPNSVATSKPFQQAFLGR